MLFEQLTVCAHNSKGKPLSWLHDANEGSRCKWKFSMQIKVLDANEGSRYTIQGKKKLLSCRVGISGPFISINNHSWCRWLTYMYHHHLNFSFSYPKPTTKISHSILPKTTPTLCSFELNTILSEILLNEEQTNNVSSTVYVRQFNNHTCYLQICCNICVVTQSQNTLCLLNYILLFV